MTVSTCHEAQGTGGDVDCFAGDTILVVYDTEKLWNRVGGDIRDQIQTLDGQPPSKLTLATMVASQCGGRLVNRLSPYHFSDGNVEVSLTLHGYSLCMGKDPCKVSVNSTFPSEKW